MRAWKNLFGFLCIALFAGRLYADDRKGDGKEPLTDAKFVQMAAQGGMTEVQGGMIAEKKAANPDVKKFGARMVTDHTKANSELKTIAKDEGLLFPIQLSSKQEKMLAALNEKNADSFDKEYIRHMVEDHENMVKLLAHASKELKNERLRSFAEETLPTIKEHLEMAKRIKAQLEKGSR